MSSFCAVSRNNAIIIMAFSEGNEIEEAKGEGGELIEICGTQEDAMRRYPESYQRQVRNSLLAIKGEKVRELFDLMSEEIFFETNLRLVLLDASNEDLNTIRRVFEKAPKARGKE